MLDTYFDQMTRAAVSRGRSLLEAVRAAGLPTSTFYRWQLGAATPTEAKARRVMQAIEDFSDEGRAATGV